MRINKIFLTLIVLIAFTLSGCKGTNENSGNNDSPISEFDQELLAKLPIETRDFYIGTAGFFPTNWPDQGISDILTFWSDTQNAGDVYGVHTDWKDTKIIDTSTENTDMSLVVVLGFQDPTEWKNSKKDFQKTVEDLLLKYPQIKYLGIGNEVNLLKEKYPTQYKDFIAAYRESYDAVKSKYPDVKVFPVFQLEAMKGNGYLTGLADKRSPDWAQLSQFEDKMDMAVFTTYPHMDYKNPSDIPADYFSEISLHTAKPVGFTEIGWPSRESYGGKYADLNTQGYVGSEQEQFDYLIRFLELTKDTDMEFANWIFLNDFGKWENGVQNDNLTIFDSLGLRYNDGTEKRVWELWLALKSLKFS